MKLIPYVNIKMGTASLPRRSNGNTLPLVQMPFGMAAFSVQTDGSKDGWFFHPSHEFAEGIRLTHQPSPWINDYGTFLMMPQNDVVSDSAGGAWSGVRPSDSVYRPDYLKVKFLRSAATFELTPTERGAAVRLTFSDERPSFLSFLPVKGNYTYRFDKEKSTLFGMTDGHSCDAAKEFKMYFAVRFDAGAVDCERTYQRGENNSACIHIALTKKQVEARIGISYISEEMAELALERECGAASFEALRQKAEDAWEEKLHRIEIEAHSEEQMRTFYSCLWRTFLFPHKAYELNAAGEIVHYIPSSGGVGNGVRYTDNGFWDTARTVYPLFARIAREEFAKMLEGFVCDYKECGWLPRWVSIGEVGCMPSTLIDGVIAEAAVHEIGSRAVLEDALEGMLHHANHEAEDSRYGRNGALSYLRYGYVPRDEQRESVNLTEDAAYGDWCIATVARMLGREDIVPVYEKRAENYKNIFDSKSGFMRGRDSKGEMAEFFDPCSWGGEYTEGSAWQNSFFVPHDIEGLAALYGGREALVKKLDELFAASPDYRVFGYGGEIHEMTEMALVDFGQCAISNQPSFHIPFLYSLLGEQEKTDAIVKRLAEEAFSSGDDGYPGDEDNGSMSAWYIFATLGFYPVCPGSKTVARCRCLVKRAKLLGQEL